MNKKLLILLLSNYGSMISIGIYTPIFALYVVELGGTVAEAGIATAIYFIAGGIMMLLLRLIINKSSNRPKYYVLGNALETVTPLLVIVVSSVTQFYMVQLVHALATALRIPSQRALYAQFEDKGREGSEWSVMEGGNFIIIGVSAAVGGVVAANISFDTVFLVMAGVQFVTTLYCLKLIKHKNWYGSKYLERIENYVDRPL